MKEGIFVFGTPWYMAYFLITKYMPNIEEIKLVLNVLAPVLINTPTPSIE